MHFYWLKEGSEVRKRPRKFSLLLDSLAFTSCHLIGAGTAILGKLLLLPHHCVAVLKRLSSSLGEVKSPKYVNNKTEASQVSTYLPRYLQKLLADTDQASEGRIDTTYPPVRLLWNLGKLENLPQANQP